MPEKSVLILGLFVNTNAAVQNIRTAEDRVASMFKKYGIPVITASEKQGRIERFTDTLTTLFIRRKEYDMVIVPLFGTWPSFIWQELVTVLLKMLDKKIILGIHGGSIPERIDAGAKRFHRAMKRSDLLVAPSEYLETYFKNKGFAVHIIENPVDLSIYTFCAKEIIRPRILWMRAFSDIYNPLMAVRVAKILAEKYPHFQMVMAGKEGPLSDAAKELAVSYGLKNNIVFPGYINMQQKQQFAAAYDIYICTNNIDNAPVSLTEFMCLGLPVVSVNTGGIPYMIRDGVNGLLVNKDDDATMAEKIELLINDQQLAQSIITNAVAYAQQYDEKNVIKKWQTLFNELENV